MEGGFDAQPLQVREDAERINAERDETGLDRLHLRGVRELLLMRGGEARYEAAGVNKLRRKYHTLQLELHQVVVRMPHTGLKLRTLVYLN